jgi:hypothetical protein
MFLELLGWGCFRLQLEGYICGTIHGVFGEDLAHNHIHRGERAYKHPATLSLPLNIKPF